MLYRRRVLLALLEVFGGSKLGRTVLQKHLFLFTREYQKEVSYDFVPFRYGCFSFLSYADLDRLEKLGFLDRGWKRLGNQSFLDTLHKEDQKKLREFWKDYANKTKNDLIRYV